MVGLLSELQFTLAIFDYQTKSAPFPLSCFRRLVSMQNYNFQNCHTISKHNIFFQQLNMLAQLDFITIFTMLGEKVINV